MFLFLSTYYLVSLGASPPSIQPSHSQRLYSCFVCHSSLSAASAAISISIQMGTREEGAEEWGRREEKRRGERDRDRDIERERERESWRPRRWGVRTGQLHSPQLHCRHTSITDSAEFMNPTPKEQTSQATLVGRSKFHFARFTRSYPPNTSVFLFRPLTPLHPPSSPVPRPFLTRSSPVPRPALASSNLAVKTGKREIY